MVMCPHLTGSEKILIKINYNKPYIFNVTPRTTTSKKLQYTKTLYEKITP